MLDSVNYVIYTAQQIVSTITYDNPDVSYQKGIKHNVVTEIKFFYIPCIIKNGLDISTKLQKQNSQITPKS